MLVKKEDLFRAIGLGTSLGLSIALPIAGGAFLGIWLDNQIGSHPRWTLNFLFLGFFLAMAVLYQQTQEWKKG